MTPAEHLRSRTGWAVLVVLLALEALLVGWVTLIAVAALFGSSGVLVQVLSLLVMAAVSLAWVIITLVGAARSRVSWVRGSALTIHVLLFAAGTGCLQLQIGPWWIGVALVVVALVGFAAALVARPIANPTLGSEN